MQMMTNHAKPSSTAPNSSILLADSGISAVKKTSALNTAEGILAAVLCAATFVLVAYPCLRAAWFGVSQFQDDSFYYLVTARNFLRLGIFTFDGVNPTNGFQPLWMGAIVGLFKALGPGATLELRILGVNALEKCALGTAVASAVYLFIRARRTKLPWAFGYFALTLLLLCPFYVIFDQGMETTIAVLILIFVVHAFLSDRLLFLGVALSLLFLARLDTAVFIAGPLLIWTAWRGIAGAKNAWNAIIIFMLTFFSYIGVNFATTGHIVPISGAIKSSFPVLRWQGAFFTEPLTLAKMFGWASLVRGINMVECTALIVAGLGLLFAAVPSRGIRHKQLMLALISGLLVANLLMFQKWDKSIDPRYLALPMAIATMFFANSLVLATERARMWLDQAAARIPWNKEGRLGWWPASIRMGLSALSALPFVLISLLLLAEAGAHLMRFRAYADRREDPIRQIYLEVDRVLPKEAVVAGTDVGAMAYWTQRRVINLDGVINNFEYQQYLRSGGLRDYLREQGVTHLATALWDREQTYTGRPIERMYKQVLDPSAERGLDYKRHEFFVYSYLYGVYSDKITLTPREEVYRKFVGKDGIADAAYVIYRFPG